MTATIVTVTKKTWSCRALFKTALLLSSREKSVGGTKQKEKSLCAPLVKTIHVLSFMYVYVCLLPASLFSRRKWLSQIYLRSFWVAWVCEIWGSILFNTIIVENDSFLYSSLLVYNVICFISFLSNVIQFQLLSLSKRMGWRTRRSTYSRWISIDCHRDYGICFKQSKNEHLKSFSCLVLLGGRY